MTHTHTATVSPAELQVLHAIKRELVSRQTSTSPGGRSYDFGRWLQRTDRDPHGSNVGHNVTRAVDDLMRRGLVRASADVDKGRRLAVLTADGIELLGGTR